MKVEKIVVVNGSGHDDKIYAHVVAHLFYSAHRLRIVRNVGHGVFVLRIILENRIRFKVTLKVGYRLGVTLALVISTRFGVENIENLAQVLVLKRRRTYLVESVHRVCKHIAQVERSVRFSAYMTVQAVGERAAVRTVRDGVAEIHV